MSRFNKNAHVMVRMTDQQKARLSKGAKKVTVQRGATVKPATLAHEFILEGLDRLLGSENHQGEPLSAAS